jgi:hypothetical protein
VTTLKRFFSYEGYTGVQENGFSEARHQQVVAVEEIASLEESRQFWRVACPPRGLGWNSCHTRQADFAEEETAQLEEEKEVSRSFVIVKRTEQEDQRLQLEEGDDIERIDMLIFYEEEQTKDRLPYLSPPKKVTHRRITPVPCSLQQVITTKAASTGAAAATIRGSNKRKRAPRKCQRCLHFGGDHHATTCNGSKGSYGQKGCEYYTSTGHKKTSPNMRNKH